MTLLRFETRLVLRAAFALGLAGAVPGWAAAQDTSACPLWAQLQSAAKALDVAQAAAVEKEIGTDPERDCNALAADARKVMLDIYRGQDARLEQANAPLQQRLAQLNAALQYNNGWNAWDIQARIADLTRKLPGARPEVISMAYDRAVMAIDEAPREAQPPPAQIGRVVRLAYQYEALSAVPVPRTSQLSRSSRQINVGYVPAPLQFEYDKAELTAAGKTQAANLLRQLQAMKLPPLHLIGHTDPVGSDAYNMDLSARRAATVKGFLVANGYPAQSITTEGRGKRDVGKLQIEDRSSFTQAQIHQMLRRVELVVKD
ncbi:MAG TPA: OmpA family protein [Hyphomicrobiaceae bacterium]|nr:OmpA family protein [Hyphomicrobiaceae bacterium]